MLGTPSPENSSPQDETPSDGRTGCWDRHNDVSKRDGTAIPQTHYLTAELPGVGGYLKATPEDFVVEEQPLYEASGEGEHLYLWLQKRDLSHEKLLQHLSQSLNISRYDVGTAGMKDRRAVTRQWVSVPARCEEKIGAVESDHVQVLDAKRHGNALKTGHCRSNRFKIRVHGIAADADPKVAAITEQLERFGCPNYYGSQRFGINGETLITGHQLVSGVLDQNEIPKLRRKFLTRLGISALQSAVFNDVLAARLQDELFSTVLVGDVMSFPNSRAVFEVADAGPEQARFDAGEILITGPMMGVKMRGPSGVPEQREQNAVHARGLRVGQFQRWKSVAPGARRPLVVRPEFHHIDVTAEVLEIDMTLPSGSFATVVLDEFMKTGVSV